jgi:hypothetical protein
MSFLIKIKNALRPKSNLIFLAINSLFILLLLYLPYYLFDGRPYLGGDDTRFYYIYPWNFLTQFTLYSWNNISSLPYYIPNHHWLPLVAVLSALDYMINSKVILFNLSFSTLFILGFIYFQKLVRELIGKENNISILSAIIYILSPITLVSLMFYLAPAWLIALIPIISYYYVAFIKRAKISDLIKIVIWSFSLSFVFYSIPWIAGFIIPLVCGLLFYLLFIDNPAKKIIVRTLIFTFFIISSQLFWVIPFIKSLTSGGSTSLTEKIVSTDLAESLRNSINSTATDNILYPLLTFYHRKIVIDFEWHLKQIFLNYYDIVMPLSIIFIIILFLGVLNYNRVLSLNLKRLYIFIFVIFLAILYFSTVNIGFLKQIFYYLGFLPGFGIFRNFTDKFALAFIFYYSIILAFSFYIIKKTNKYYSILLLLTSIVVLINFVPFKQVILSPLWKTKNIYTTVHLPEEYISFTQKAKEMVPISTNIFTLPQNNTAYAVITEDNNTHAYVGTSPFKFMTGINDLTGMDSYNHSLSSTIQRLIKQRKYNEFLSLLTQINSGYIIVVNNIPQEVLHSYLFDKEYMKYQDNNLLRAITAKEILRSTQGNYVLYKLKNKTAILASDTNIKYSRLNPVTYKINFKNLKGSHNLVFKETFHPGWELLIKNKPIFNNSHKELLPYGNKWTINADEIKKSFDNSFYKTNNDGSIDVSIQLYFTYQNYFYAGCVMTILFIVSGLFVYKRWNKNEK